jgi:hypothetical protein
MKINGTNKRVITVGATSLGFFLFLFIITKFQTPSFSELSFIEKSSHAVGSVIPASCDSSPAVSHFSGDCPSICSGSANPLYSSNTIYDNASNMCVCANGSPVSTVPDCPPPVVKVNLTNTPYVFLKINSFAAADIYVDRCIQNSTTINWNVSGADSCTGSWAGSISSSGSYSATVSGTAGQTQSYTITCNKAGATSVSAHESVYFTRSDASYCSGGL